MHMNIEYGKQRKHIKICPLTPVERMWDHLQNALVTRLWNLNETPMTSNDQILSHYGDFVLKLKGEHETTINVGASEWRETRWNEQEDVFIVEGSIKERIEEKMDLVVAAHRGHYESYHPENLYLSTGPFYCSKSGLPSEDWILFKRTTQKSFYATKLMFMNSWRNESIKTVVVLWSENGEQYHKWTHINGINKGDERQWFHLNENEIATAGGKLQYVKLEIVKNYGHRWTNCFKEFAVYGFCVSGE